MSPIMFKIGNIGIRWYSVLILIAFIIGYILVITRARKKGISGVYVSDISLYLIIFCIIGARLYYCLFNMDYYKDNLVEILMIWRGGLAIHGGIIAGIIVLTIYTKKYQIGFFRMTDIIAPALALGQAIGRWGNFFNSEAHGIETTYAALKGYHIPEFIIKGMKIDGVYYHPTFFYESLLCLIGFFIALFLRRRKNIKLTNITSFYLIWYGTVRILIEILRTDSLMIGNFKMAIIVSILMIIIGIILFIISLTKSKFENKYNDIENVKNINF